MTYDKKDWKEEGSQRLTKEEKAEIKDGKKKEKEKNKLKSSY